MPAPSETDNSRHEIPIEDCCELRASMTGVLKVVDEAI